MHGLDQIMAINDQNSETVPSFDAMSQREADEILGRFILGKYYKVRKNEQSRAVNNNKELDRAPTISKRLGNKIYRSNKITKKNKVIKMPGLEIINRLLETIKHNNHKQERRTP